MYESNKKILHQKNNVMLYEAQKKLVSKNKIYLTFGISIDFKDGKTKLIYHISVDDGMEKDTLLRYMKEDFDFISNYYKINKFDSYLSLIKNDDLTSQFIKYLNFTSYQFLPLNKENSKELSYYRDKIDILKSILESRIDIKKDFSVQNENGVWKCVNRKTGVVKLKSRNKDEAVKKAKKIAKMPTSMVSNKEERELEIASYSRINSLLCERYNSKTGFVKREVVKLLNEPLTREVYEQLKGYAKQPQKSKIEKKKDKSFLRKKTKTESVKRDEMNYQDAVEKEEGERKQKQKRKRFF